MKSALDAARHLTLRLRHTGLCGSQTYVSQKPVCSAAHQSRSGKVSVTCPWWSYCQEGAADFRVLVAGTKHTFSSGFASLSSILFCRSLIIRGMCCDSPPLGSMCDYVVFDQRRSKHLFGRF